MTGMGILNGFDLPTFVGRAQFEELSPGFPSPCSREREYRYRRAGLLRPWWRGGRQP